MTASLACVDPGTIWHCASLGSHGCSTFRPLSCLLVLWLVTGMSWVSLAGVGLVTLLFIYQHSLLKPE